MARNSADRCASAIRSCRRHTSAMNSVSRASHSHRARARRILQLPLRLIVSCTIRKRSLDLNFSYFSLPIIGKHNALVVAAHSHRCIIHCGPVEHQRHSQQIAFSAPGTKVGSVRNSVVNDCREILPAERDGSLQEIAL